ncbi:MAG: FAD-dependent oxidoreductase, partial [Rubrivivax sp.]|nr:FAD-dependent oxidoreductase [Rubrivivax sp.]
MNKKKSLLLVGLLGLVLLFFVFDLGRFFSLDFAKSAQADFAQLYATRPALVLGGFFAVYVAVTALSLPGAAIMTLVAGAIFGLWVGLVLVSFASSLGALLAMLFARYVLRDAVKARFGARLADIDKGIEREGAFYLFTLRLVPVFPFFVINLLMGLTAIKARTFYWVSQLGMLAGTAVFVNAGTQLAQLTSLQGVLSPGLIGSFVLLGVFPLVAKKIVDAVKARRVYAPWADKKPRQFDRNMVVIGAGAAGLVTSYIAAAVKAKVTLVENHKMGGDCLNYGCVPSKALIKTATLARQMRHSADYGIASAEYRLDFAQVMDRIAHVVREIEPHDSVERYRGLGVDVQIGTAKILDPWRVQITAADGTVQVLSTRSIVIATGARPFVPPLPGLDQVGYETSDTIWGLTQLPPRLVVLGGGPIGCELAQSFARLGSKVTQVEMAARVMLREDPEVSEL